MSSSPFDLENVSVYIVAGGKSSRFGEDKASFVYQGKALIEHVRDTFSVLGKVKVVAKAPRTFDEYNLDVVYDIEGEGPLAGIHAALKNTSTEWIFVVPTDTLDFKLEWLNAFQGREKKAIAFHNGDHWLPLFSAFHKNALSQVEKNLKNDNRSLRKLLDDLDAHPVTLPEDWHLLHRIDYKKNL